MSCPACMPRMAGKMCSNVLVTTVLQKVRHRLLCRGRIAADLVEDNHCFQTGLSILGDLMNSSLEVAAEVGCHFSFYGLHAVFGSAHCESRKNGICQFTRKNLPTHFDAALRTMRGGNRFIGIGEGIKKGPSAQHIPVFNPCPALQLYKRVA